MFIDRDTQLTNGKVQFASYPLGRLVAERVEWRWRGGLKLHQSNSADHSAMHTMHTKYKSQIKRS